MATYLKLGELLPLELQLGDGAKFPTTRVFARIDKIDGTNLVAEFELTNNGEGNYTDLLNTMPTFSVIKVVYFIRQADGVTPEVKYNPYYLTEIFLRDATAELIDTNLDSTVSSAKVVPVSIVGVIDKNLIEASIEVVAIEAVIKDNNTIIGVVNEC